MLKGTEGDVKRSLANATILCVPYSSLWFLVSPFSLGAPKLMVPPLKKCYRKKVSFQPAEALKGEMFSVFRGILLICALAALCLFVPILPHSFLNIFAICPPLSHPALWSYPSIFFLFSLCSLIPKWNQIWQYSASKISCYGHSALQKNPCKVDLDGTQEPPVCFMHPQLPLFWQLVTWYSHNEQLFNILLDPHCSLHDLGYYYRVLFEEHYEYKITNFCKGFSLVFMTAGSEYITKHWVWWAPGFFVHSHFMTMKQTL